MTDPTHTTTDVERVARKFYEIIVDATGAPLSSRELADTLAEHAMAALPHREGSVQEAARVLLDAMDSGLDAFDVDGDNEIEGLAVKWSGNRGDGAIQLEIAEEFMRESLRALAGDKP